MKTLKIVKIGGNIINDTNHLNAFLQKFSQLEGPKILVHGGGKLATEVARTMNIPVQMIDGRRITDAKTLDIVTMVYGGKINKNIVAILQKYSCNAIGFTGADGNTIQAKKRAVSAIDYGFVGDITHVNTEVLSLLIQNNITPIFSAITHDGSGQLLNTNADTIASEIAIGMTEKITTELYYCFEKPGVLADIEDENSVVEELSIEDYHTLKAQNLIYDGMLPKLDNCYHALYSNVSKVCIGNTEMLFNSEEKHTTLLIQ